MKIIKKYPNRRLYDSDLSKYITQDDVKQYARDNVLFRIEDVKTNSDITHSVLLQIIGDSELTSFNTFSTDALKQIMRYYDDPLHSALSLYLERCLEKFAANEAQLRERMTTFDAKSPLELIEELVATA